MLKKGLNLFLLVSCLLFVASIVDASPLPLWQLHVGDRSAFTKHDSIGTTWIVTTTVVGTQTFNVEGIDREYFHVQEYNYNNNEETVDLYMRTEDNKGYLYNGSGEDLFVQAAPLNTIWNYPIPGGTRYLEITAIGQVAVPYGTFQDAYEIRAYEIIGANPATPYVYNYFVPGFGMVKEVDYNVETNAPTTSELTQINSRLFANFGAAGIWQWDVVTSEWSQINEGNPVSMEASGSEALYASFTGSGLYKYNGTTWTRLHTVVPERIVASGSFLYANFTGSGLYKHNGTAWIRIHTSISESMTASGSDLYANFTGSGLWKYDGAVWTRLNKVVSESMAASGSDLYANFTGSGLYKHDGTVWTKLNKVVSENMVASGTNLYANFTGSGLWKYDGAVWTRLNKVVSENMVASGSTVYANFTGSGLYKHDGTVWTKLNKVVSENMVVSGSDLYASLTGSGLYKHDGTAWTRINTSIPESMLTWW